MTFDLVLPTLLQICEKQPGFEQVEHACVVRDVQGRVRLVLKTKADLDIGALSGALSAELQRFFATPILTMAQGGEHRRLAEALLQRAPRKSWPLGWPTEIVEPITGTKQPLPDRWSGIERTVAKESWLAQKLPALPWPAHPKTPRLVTFYSFKGGVGRTTLVAAYALHLARRGTKVAVIDLDLEAPGIGTLLDVRPTRGVIDLLADHIATNTMDLDNSYGYADAFGDLAGKIAIFPAGRIDAAFVSKLARLDFASAEVGGTTKNAVADALKELLRQLKEDGYGAMLLDARAGLHDLAGLSLHGLAHLDVLVFRGTTQNLDGLSLTLDVLHRRRRDEGRPWILVHTLLPPGQEDFERKRRDIQERVYNIFYKHIYEGDDVPQLDDLDAAHETLPLRRKPWLEDVDTLRGLAEMLHSDEDLSNIMRRIDERWEEDNAKDEEKDAS